MSTIFTVINCDHQNGLMEQKYYLWFLLDFQRFLYKPYIFVYIFFLYNAVCVVNTLRWKKTNWNYTLFSEIREQIVRCYRVVVWLRLISFRTFNPTNIYTFKIMRVFCFWLCKFDFSNVKNIFSIHFMFQTTLHTRSKCLRFQTTVWFGYPIMLQTIFPTFWKKTYWNQKCWQFLICVYR